MKFGRKILEGYLAVVISILTVIVFLILGTISFESNPGISVLNILIVILTGIEILQAILLLRILDKIGE